MQFSSSCEIGLHILRAPRLVELAGYFKEVAIDVLRNVLLGLVLLHDVFKQVVQDGVIVSIHKAHQVFAVFVIGREPMNCEPFAELAPGVLGPFHV
jgi:hypothetical protein